jgi:hypothetical protein
MLQADSVVKRFGPSPQRLELSIAGAISLLFTFHLSLFTLLPQRREGIDPRRSESRE